VIESPCTLRRQIEYSSVSVSSMALWTTFCRSKHILSHARENNGLWSVRALLVKNIDSYARLLLRSPLGSADRKERHDLEQSAGVQRLLEIGLGAEFPTALFHLLVGGQEYDGDVPGLRVGLKGVDELVAA
jgi:hypothetical protein